MPRILHVITGLGVGGAERSLFNLLDAGLKGCGDNHVVSLGDAGHFGPKLDRIGVPVHCLGMKPSALSLQAMVRLARLTRRIKPDVIQGWMYHGNLAASFARAIAMRQAALVWNIRQSLYDIADEKPATRSVIRAGKFLSGRVDRIVYNSKTAKSQHETLGFADARSKVIPNGFDPAKWHQDAIQRERLRLEFSIPRDSRVIGYVGRFHPMKDLPNFLRAAGKLLQDDAELHLVLIGRNLGPDNPVLTDFYANLPKQRCHVLGERSDIPALLSTIDILCLSSAWGEGFPNVLGEAMASGIPCVATDIGDCAHIIGETGKIVKARDPVGLVNAVQDLFENPQAGPLARNRITQNFSMDRMIRTYRKLYQSLSAEPI